MENENGAGVTTERVRTIGQATPAIPGQPGVAASHGTVPPATSGMAPLPAQPAMPTPDAIARDTVRRTAAGAPLSIAADPLSEPRR